MDYTDSTDYF